MPFSRLDLTKGQVYNEFFSEACPNRKVTIHKDIAGMDRMIIVSGKEAQ